MLTTIPLYCTLAPHASQVRMLEPIHSSSPSTDLRVLVLTDGQNNSGAKPQVGPHLCQPRATVHLGFRSSLRDLALFVVALLRSWFLSPCL